MRREPLHPLAFRRPTRVRVAVLFALVALVAVLVAPSGGVPNAVRGSSPGLAPAHAAVTSTSSAAQAPVETAAPAPTSLASDPAPAIKGPPAPQPTWVNVTNTTAGHEPPAAWGSASAYDPVDNETVYFGGCATGSCPDNQTWVYANGSWSNITDHKDDPPKTAYSSMDYDANMHAVLLFGGCLDTNCSDVTNDTWTFVNGTWTNVSYFGPGPAARGGASMAFDPQTEENGSVLFGGCVSGFLGFLFCFNDTWVWEGDGGWVNLTPTFGPGPLGFAQMAYDPATGDVVLFGGVELFIIDSYTWELYSGQWWNVTGTASPQGRAYGSMIYDPGLTSLVMFGGLNASAEYANDTWVFAATGWTEQKPSSSPEVRGSYDLTLDATGTTPILEGGNNNAVTFGDTWAYEFAPTVSLTHSVSSAEVAEKVTFHAMLGHGTVPYDLTFEFGDGSDAYATGSSTEISADHTFDSAGTFLVSVFVTDAVGAASSATGYSFAVSAGPSVTAASRPSAGDVGLPVEFLSTIVLNGTLPLNFTWDFGDHTSAYGQGPTHSYAAAGVYTVKLKAKDSVNVTDTVSFSLTIAPFPSLAVAATSTSPAQGAITTFFANITGGSGPFSYSWRFGDHTGSALPVPQHPFAGPGTYTVKVWVNDSAGASTNASISVTVPSPATSAWGSVSGAPLWFWAGIGVLAVVGLLGSVVMVRRGRLPKP
ncbi:MAG: PKD domain-containing protein [Thermoplasmata archaeon]